MKRSWRAHRLFRGRLNASARALALAAAGLSAADLHRAAVPEIAEADRDDHFTGAEAGFDHRLPVVLQRDLDLPHPGPAVRSYDINDGLVGGVALDRARRHNDNLRQGFNQHAHVDELPRPELELGIGKL